MGVALALLAKNIVDVREGNEVVLVALAPQPMV